MVTDLRPTLRAGTSRLLGGLLIGGSLAACTPAAGPVAVAAPLAVKVVIVATFEVGRDTGDAPGELQHWVEQEHLDRELPFPAGGRSVRLSADGGVLAVVAGTSPTDASASIMAIALDPRFDLSRAYWIVSGIAGVDPENASLASVAWANVVLDGDQVHEIDSREAPAAWPYGRLALGAHAPNQLPAGTRKLVYELNAGLVDWAFRLTKDVALADTPALAAHRAAYRGFHKALEPPFVLEGADLGSGTYWHGAVMTRWANDWVTLLTAGRADFVMTNMEDHGVAAALRRLDAMGTVDFRRVLFLRAASNYSRQAPGQKVEQSLTDGYSAAVPAFDSTHRVGSVVLHELLGNWAAWRDTIPGS